MSKNSNSKRVIVVRLKKKKNCVIVGPQFCVPYAVNLTIVQKSTGNYSVVDKDGDIVFKVKPPGQRHILYDGGGKPILSMQPKTPDAWNVFRGDSHDPRHLLFTVEKAPGWDSDLIVSLTGDGGRFTIRKSWLGGSYKMYSGANVIAGMQRKLTDQSPSFGMDNLEVNVEPNVDYAFIVAHVIMLHTLVLGHENELILGNENGSNKERGERCTLKICND